MLCGAAADFVQQLAGTLTRIVGAKHILIGAKLTRGALAAAKRVLLLGLAILTELCALLTLTILLLLRERLTKVLHAFAQGIHRLCLIIDRPGQIALIQRVGGIVHCPTRTAQRVARGIPRLSALTG